MCVCLCDVSCVFQQPQTEVYGPHKDSVQPHKNRHSNQSATEKSLTDHTHTLKIWPHAPCGSPPVGSCTLGSGE